MTNMFGSYCRVERWLTDILDTEAYGLVEFHCFGANKVAATSGSSYLP